MNNEEEYDRGGGDIIGLGSPSRYEEIRIPLLYGLDPFGHLKAGVTVYERDGGQSNLFLGLKVHESFVDPEKSSLLAFSYPWRSLCEDLGMEREPKVELGMKTVEGQTYLYVRIHYYGSVPCSLDEGMDTLEEYLDTLLERGVLLYHPR